MLKRLRMDFLKGLARIRWFSGVISDRLKIEVAIVKLLFKSDEIGQKKSELLGIIGARVYELKDNPDKNLLKDRVVAEAVEAIGQLEKEIVELDRKVEELSRAGI